MNRYSLAPLVLALLFAGQAASAYVGPGAGITAIGTVLALLGAAVLAIAGFVWYPLKRLLRRRPERPASAAAPRQK
jgi:hypothetical protein